MDEFSTSKYWIEQALKSIQKGENEKARSFAAQAVELDDNNIDAKILYVSTLIKKLDNPSLHKLETNLANSTKILAFLRQKGIDKELTKTQEEKLSELYSPQYDFIEYVHHERYKTENPFLYL